MKGIHERALNPPEIQSQNGNSDAVADSGFQLGGDEAETALALCQTEAALYLHPLAFIDVVFLFVKLNFLTGRPSAGPDNRMPRSLQ